MYATGELIARSSSLSDSLCERASYSEMLGYANRQLEQRC